MTQHGAAAFALCCGSVFVGAAEPAFAASFTLLHSFQGAEGADPLAGLIAARGLLYGTTFRGGAANDGTVFSLNPTPGATKLVYSLSGGKNAATPLAGLTYVGGVLYGATTYGGASGNGTVFSLDPKTGAEHVVYSFPGGAGGAHPQASLLYKGGVLFGTTTNGGAAGFGTVFSIVLKTGHERVLYSFLGGSDGAYPFATLLNVGGTLFGTTEGGGSASCTPNGCGTVFSVAPVTGTETVVHAFQGGSDGASPYGGLIVVGGLLYGTTTDGGGTGCTHGCGTVFSLDPASGAEKIAYAFQNNGDGATPIGNLASIGGILFGVTQVGGANIYGSIFALNPATGALTSLYSFTGGSDGANPYGGLIAFDGVLYGTTQVGGANRDGTVFSVAP